MAEKFPMPTWADYDLVEPEIEAACRTIVAARGDNPDDTCMVFVGKEWSTIERWRAAAPLMRLAVAAYLSVKSP